MKYLLDGQETDRLIFRKVSWSDFDDWVNSLKIRLLQFTGWKKKNRHNVNVESGMRNSMGDMKMTKAV